MGVVYGAPDFEIMETLRLSADAWRSVRDRASELERIAVSRRFGPVACGGSLSRYHTVRLRWWCAGDVWTPPMRDGATP